MGKSEKLVLGLEPLSPRDPGEISKIKKEPQLSLFTNKELVDFGIREGLIEKGESAKDLAKVFTEYDKDLGDFMMKIVEYNIKSKGGKKQKSFSATGVVDSVYYKNPREYLSKIQEKLKDSTSKLTLLKTMFGIQEETKANIDSILIGKKSHFSDPNKETVEHMEKQRKKNYNQLLKRPKRKNLKNLLKTGKKDNSKNFGEIF